ncbi:glycosyltransferase [Gordonia sp. PKS22-38]|uniref:Glycosyltransferase n=1 Tax=Gordonia prachuapensis TaxID=3115651 RepID=A0ABU7MV95_9ACTN|nr:glycosyltransferase [Gordonia sp. PKS22-38]
MEFVVAAGGSRGDVQPAVALGGELVDRGHVVTMMVPPNLTAFVEGAGLTAISYGENTKDVLDSDLVRNDLRSRNPRTRLRAVADLTVRGGRTMQQQLLDACTTADAIVAGSVGQERAHNVARARGLPHIPLHLCPLRTNGSTSMLAHLGIDPPPPLARLSWRALEWTLWLAGRSAEKTLCDDLGITPARAPFAHQIAATGVPEIQAYDPAMFPGLVDEWGTRRPLVGFFTLPGRLRKGVGDSSSDDVAGWIDAGPPPVYVGFGSMAPADPDALATAIQVAAEHLDVRLLVAGGWSGFMAGAADDRIHVVDHVDHDAILPRCAAAVHHGGAGTVAAVLRAGIPSVITWIGADQPIWGRAVTASHVGTSLPMSQVQPARLVDALSAALTVPTRRAAAHLARELISPGEAVAAAADIAERVVEGRSREHSF